MSIESDFAKYRDKYGMNQLEPGVTSQNGTLFTVEYLLCLASQPNVPKSYIEEEFKRIASVFATIEPFPGISSRHPGSLEFDSMDNTGALYTFSGLTDGEFSKRALKHGREVVEEGLDTTQEYDDLAKKYYMLARILYWPKRPRMFWNNNHPNLFCFFGWHGRSPSHIAMLKWTSGESLSLWEKFTILVGQFIEINNNHTDHQKLPYVNWQFLKTKGSFWRFAYRMWIKLLLRKYPNGMVDVYSKYYPAGHPISKYSLPFIP